MPKPIIRAVFKRDLKSWFGNPTGYVFIVLFSLLAAIAMVFSDRFFQVNLANLDTLTSWFRIMLLLFVPAITMGIWSNERSNGTQELLFTLPARDFQILMGKYLAGVAIYTISLAFTLVLPLGLFLMGNPDIGLLASTYLAYWLVGVMLIAAAMIAGHLTDNVAVSFIIGALICAVIMFSDMLVGWLPWGLGGGWAVYGPTGMFADLTRGVVTPSAGLVFLGWTAAFLYFNLALIQRRHVSDTVEFGLHRWVRMCAMLVVFVGLAIWGLNNLPRVDATVEKVHSLSENTGTLLAELDEKRPVYVQAYVSEDMPQALVRTKRSLLDLLDQYDKQAGAALEVRIVPTEPFSKAAEEAGENYQIAGMGNPAEPTYLGVAVQCGTEEVTVPAFLPGMSVEYELTRSIRAVAKAERRTVGILKTDVELQGGMDFQTMRQRPSWPIVDELELQYNVEGAVSPDADYPDELAVLIVPMVSSLTQPQMDRLMTYIRGGNKVVLLDDPQPWAAPGMSATDPKGGQQNPFMQQQQPKEQKGNIDAFMTQLDIRYPYRQVMFDRFSPHALIDNAAMPEQMFVDAQVEDGVRPESGLNQESPITKDLSQVVVIFGGQVSEVDSTNSLNFEPLLRTSTLSGALGKDSVMVANFFGQAQLNPSRVHRQSVPPKQSALACRVTGTMPAPPSTGEETAEESKPIDVVFMADLDMISSMFFEMQKSGRGAEVGIRFDNVSLILNTIDELAGDRSFIELRSRRPEHRRLETIEEESREFNERLQADKADAEEAAKEELDAAQERLNAVVKAIEDDPSLDQNSKAREKAAAQNVEQRSVDRAKERIEREKNRKNLKSERERREQVSSIHRKYQILMLVGAVVPPVAVGLVVLLMRRRRQAVIVPESRMKRGVA